MRSSSERTRWAAMRWLLVMVVLVGSSAVSCGDDDDGGDGEAGLANPAAVYCEAQGGVVSGPEPMCELPDGSVVDAWTYYREANGGSTDDVERLGGMLQLLLTTGEIGGGWVDQGRVIVPAGSNQRTGVLCAEGDELVGSLGSSFDPQVHTIYRQADATTPQVSETLLVGATESVTADLATWADGIAACAGGPFESADGSTNVIATFDATAIDPAALGWTLGPADPPQTDPWMEVVSYEVPVVMGDTGLSVVVGVAAATVHDPGTTVAPVDDAELLRIVEAAVAKVRVAAAES